MLRARDIGIEVAKEYFLTTKILKQLNMKLQIHQLITN
jgi:hypothetical protein